MKPEKDPTPRDEQEMRLTALLMGELPPGEVVAVYAQMAADPELAALHRRLRKAMELLREASALPEQPAPPAPMQLSSARRERLLAHFKTAAPTPSATPEPIATLDPAAETPRRNWWWTVPMGLAAMLVVLLGGGLLMTNGLVQRKSAGWPDDAIAASQSALIYNRLRNVSGSQGGEFDVKTPSSEMNSAAGGRKATAEINRGSPIQRPPQMFSMNTGSAAGKGAVPLAVPATIDTFPVSHTTPSSPTAAAAVSPVNRPAAVLYLGRTTASAGESQDRAIPEEQKRSASSDLNGGSTFTGGTTFGGAIQNGDSTAALAKAGTGTLNLAGVNTYTGGTTVNAGALSLNDGTAALGTITGSSGKTISESGTLAFNNGGGTFDTATINPDASVLSNTYTAGSTVIGGWTVAANDANGSNPAAAAKFTEVQQNNTKELNFDVLHGQFGFPGGKVFAGGGTTGTSPALNSADYPFVAPGTGPSGTNSMIAGNAIDALQFPVAGSSRAVPMAGGARAAPAAASRAPSVPAIGGANNITLNGGETLAINGTGALSTDNLSTGDRFISTQDASRYENQTGGDRFFSTPGLNLATNQGGAPAAPSTPAGPHKSIIPGIDGQAEADAPAPPAARPANPLELKNSDNSSSNGVVGFAHAATAAPGPLVLNNGGPTTPDSAAGGAPGGPRGSASSVAESGKARPGDSERRSREAQQAGDVAMKAKDYEKAAAYYKNAVDLVADSSKAHALHSDAVGKFSDASTKLATQRITEGRYGDAQAALKTVIDERYDPNNKKAATTLSRLEQADYYNKTIGPKFRANVGQVKQDFIEAQGFYDSGRYALAKKRCEEILQVDPYNGAAREFEEKVDRAMDDYAIKAYNETRANAIKDVDNGWARPVRKFNLEKTPTIADGKPAASSGQEINPAGEPVRGDDEKEEVTATDTQEIRHKLESIIIPKIEFRDATVREAIEFLKKKSVELDDASPAGGKGTNIVLKLEDSGEGGGAGAPAPTPVGIPTIPGLEAASAPGAASSAASATAGVPNPAEPRITVSLTNIPLMEALKYVTGVANLKFKVEPNAVSVVPLSEPTDVLATREWKIPPGLIPGKQGADRETAKNWLVAHGVTFNGAASAFYVVKSNRLIVRDTPDQLDLVDILIKKSPAPAKAEPEAPAKKVAPSAGIPQPEIQTRENAFSTFSLNVTDVSFKLAAASLEQGHMPDPSTVRSEEFINAFDYRDPAPAPGAPLAFAAERARYPFAQNRDLLRFSVQTAAAGRQPGRPLNIVLVLDKSGSMERADRVNIVREALRVLATQLQPQDKLSIVTFARTPRLWADGVAGDKVGEMIARVSEITPEGGTNLEAALDLGYETAHRHYAVASINRVILFTDGAANLGDVNPDELTKKVEAERKQGVALDCFGIGWEGYNDDLLEQLTRNGDGRYGFLNTPEEAAENFAPQLAGALRVAASDVKVQVEFNPRRVTAYRQIGYAKHQLTKEQFRDNTVAAAQIGAAESGNALYVVAVDPQGEGDLATVRVRYRVPGTSDYREHEWTVPFTGDVPALEEAGSALRLAGTASAFSEMLAASPYAAEVTSDRLLGLLHGVPAIYGADPRPQKLEWMIHQARSLSGR